MSLSTYKKKRKFEKTPEPKGKSAASREKLTFVVQRHKATRLHYDFRLELDGVLKSWAVPKGPSMNPADKRLAMMVEDHPYDYKDFAGVIPKGNYGAGIVEIWDAGELTNLEGASKKESEKSLRAGLKSGDLKFRLKGKKLRGEFVLVKLKNAEGNAWLLIKHRDEFAVDTEYDSEQLTAASSPINKWLKKKGKEVPEIKKAVKAPAKKQAAKKKTEEPAEPVTDDRPFIRPMLARETEKAFSDPDWIYELKWDGFRAIAELRGKNVRLYSRNGNSFLEAYPAVVNALSALKLDAVLDGEIIVVDSEGRSDFQRLQQYKSDDSLPMEFRVFDLLEVKGKNICDLPLIERKSMLRKILHSGNAVVKYSDHIEGEGLRLFDLAKAKDLEGIIAKKADSEYFPGVRTNTWLKIKNHKTTEAVIAGFTAPAGGRKHFGALLLGVYEGDELRYIGHTGTGFDSETLQSLSRKLKPLHQKNSSFAGPVKTNTPAVWVKPSLVAEIKYSEWTRDGILRHPVFLRLRNDKSPKDITMGNSKPVKKAGAKAKAKKPGKKENSESSAKKSSKEDFITVGKIKVRVTNLKKIYWPDEGLTKGDVIDYYRSVSKYILPYLKDRPQSLLRNPNGIKDRGFFHKDAGDEAPDWVKSEPIHSPSANKMIDYIICNNEATLVYMNNLGCIEINPWHSTIKKQDHPDYLIIDIDPSDKNTFDQVIETANVVHEIFQKAGCESYCKTSGASGLHVYVPAGKKYTYDQLKDFAHLVCILVQEKLPRFTTLERNLKKRGDKMIYLDHLQNRKGQTISSVYSLRPKPGATVSIPLLWKEVKPGLRPSDFTIYNALKRIEKTGDIFKGVLGKGLDLRKSLELLEK